MHFNIGNLAGVFDVEVHNHLIVIRQEDDDVKTTTITVRKNGKPTELTSIVYHDENYMRIRDLADAQKDDKLTIDWDQKTKTVPVESK